MKTYLVQIPEDPDNAGYFITVSPANFLKLKRDLKNQVPGVAIEFLDVGGNTISPKDLIESLQMYVG